MPRATEWTRLPLALPEGWYDKYDRWVHSKIYPPDWICLNDIFGFGSLEIRLIAILFASIFKHFGMHIFWYLERLIFRNLGTFKLLKSLPPSEEEIQKKGRGWWIFKW